MPLTTGRALLFAAIDSAIEHGSRTQRDRDLGQSSLFGGPADSGGIDVIRLPDAAPWSEMELLGYEKALGLYLSGHPIDRHADDLRAFGARTVGDLTLGGCRPRPTGRPDACWSTTSTSAASSRACGR